MKKLRRPDLNRRRAAYETVLGTRLQSTPQSARMKDESGRVKKYNCLFFILPTSSFILSKSTPGRTRTCDPFRVREVPLPLGHGSMGKDEVGRMNQHIVIYCFILPTLSFI